MSIVPLLQCWILLIFAQIAPLDQLQKDSLYAYTTKTPSAEITAEILVTAFEVRGKSLFAELKASLTGGTDEAVSSKATLERKDGSWKLVSLDRVADEISQASKGMKAGYLLGEGGPLLLPPDLRLEREAKELPDRKVALPFAKSPIPFRQVVFRQGKSSVEVIYTPKYFLGGFRISIPDMSPELEKAEFILSRVKNQGIFMSASVDNFAQLKKDGFIIREYSGVIGVRSNLPNSSIGRVPAEYTVINNQDDYKAFVARIPAEQVSMTNPPPRNEDPLLGLPPVDFSREALLVLVANGGMYHDLRLLDFDETGGKNTFHLELKAPDENSLNLAQPQGMGHYRAYVIPKQDKESVFTVATD